MNKWLVLLVLSAATVVRAFDDDVYDEEGEERVGYVTTTANGGTILSFNSTSLQNALIVGLGLLLLSALVLAPLLLLAGKDDGGGYGSYGYEQPSYSSGGSGYEAPSSSYGAGFARRSLAIFNPILDAIRNGRKKYE